MANSLASTFTIGDISVRQLDGLFSLNDLHKAAGNESRHEPANFLRIEQTKALVEELSSAETQTLKTVIGKGKAQGTYACRELVIAYAAWISAVFHLKVIRVFLNAIRPTDRIAYTVQPGDTLTAAQAEQLRLIFKDKCDTLPKAEQAAFMTKGWSKLKSHFGVTYRKIEQREFSEALSLATRHAAEWAATPQLTMEPQPMPSKLTPATLVGLIDGGCLADSAVRDIAMASTNFLFHKAVASPTGWGEEVARKIDDKLPLADLHAIVVRATMEMTLRVHGYDISQKGAAA